MHAWRWFVSNKQGSTHVQSCAHLFCKSRARPYNHKQVFKESAIYWIYHEPSMFCPVILLDQFLIIQNKFDRGHFLKLSVSNYMALK